MSDLIAFLPDNAERVVTSTSSTASSPLDSIGWYTHEVIAPWPHMPNLIQLVVLQVLQDIQVLQAMELADQAMDFQMILKLVVAANTSVQASNLD